jgi:hypothetical protein
MSQLALVLVFAAGMLIVGQLHIRNRSSTDSFVVQELGYLGMAMRRRTNWTPVIVSNRDPKVSLADGAIARPPFSTLHVTSDPTKVLDQKIQHRGDVRFSIGVALALALPAFIGLGIYIAAESLLHLQRAS